MPKVVKRFRPVPKPPEPKVEKPKGPSGRKKGSTNEVLLKYKPEYARIAAVLAAQGATDGVLAKAFDVHTSTIRDWYSTYPAFGEAVRTGKAEVFDPLVERALAQRAVGYSVDVTEVKYVGKDADRVEDVIRKHFPPDTTACIFWLKNRQPDKWRDVHDHKHSGKVDMESKSAEMLLDEIKSELARFGITPDQAKVLGLAPPGTNGKSNGTKH